MSTPKELRYTKTHEWVRRDGNVLTVGITDFAQEQLSDLTYVELPSANDAVTAQDEVAVVESVKAASDIYAPVTGTITEVNSALIDQPELINQDPFGAGWIFKIEPDDMSEFDSLLDADSYEELLPEDEE
jgi:glycine cleavage system H protein